MSTDLRLHVIASIADIPARRWDECARAEPCSPADLLGLRVIGAWQSVR